MTETNGAMHLLFYYTTTFKKIKSHFILGGLNYYVLTSKCTYCGHIVLQNTAIEVDTGRLGTGLVVMGRLQGGLRCKGCNYKCNYRN